MVTLYELIEVLPDSYEPTFSTRVNELFFFLRNQSRKLSDQQAAENFLGGTLARKYFSKIKNELKRELVKFIIANPYVWGGFAHRRQHESCFKKFSAYKILLINEKRKAAIEIAKNLLPQLKKFELHGLIYLLAIDLRFHHSAMEGSSIEMKKYDRLVQKELEFLKVEAMVRSYHSKIALIQNTRSSYTPLMIEELKEARENVLPFLKLGSHYLNRFIYNIVICTYRAELDYSSIIKYCDEALKSLPKNHPKNTALRFNYLEMKLPSLIAKGDLGQAKDLARETCKMMSVGKFNWHLAFIRRILVCFYTSEYQEAYDLYKEQEKYDCLFPILAEYRVIIWGYLYFLIKVEKIKEYNEERFHLGKFLNEVPIYSKDKAGNNINILIIQVLTRMQREQYGQIIDRIEALETYARTYTRNPETKRANLFIKMILQMNKASFHPVATERKTRATLEKLKNTPLGMGQNLAIEMVPYEVLWDEVLGMLKRKQYGQKRKTKDVLKP